MIIAYGFIKLSLVFFYRRLFVVLKWSAFDIISLAYIAIIIMWTLAFFFLFLFMCKTKIYLHWAPLSETEDQCGDPLAPELGLVISDLITDIMILTLPMPIVCFTIPYCELSLCERVLSFDILIRINQIWRLTVHWSRKLTISLVFLVGLV
jgi:hypothetical protein